MGRKPEPPDGFECPYQHSCPHLHGYSAKWALSCIDDYEGSACENGQALILAEKENEELRAENLKLREENTRLKSNAKITHGMKFKPRRQKEASGKKRGAPLGHKPWSRPIPERIDKTIETPPPCNCPHCDNPNLIPTTLIHEQIQEDIVIQPQTQVTRYRHGMSFCSSCRRNVYDTAPGELRNCQIGPQTNAVATYLRQKLKLSLRDTRFLFKEIFKMDFVPASALRFNQRIATASQELHQELRKKVQSSEIIHGDETSWRVDGESAYLWYAGTPDFSFFHLDPSRSGSVAISIFGSPFSGGFVGDDYAGYNAIEALHRQSCLAHLIRKARDLSALLDPLPKTSEVLRAIQFCDSIKSLLQSACHLGKQRDLKEITFTQAKARIPSLIHKIDSLCAKPFHSPLQDIETFRQRLSDPKKDYHQLFTFLEINRMPPTNNHAEQSLRQPVLHRKISFGHRSLESAQDFATNLSIISTLHQQKIDPIPVLHSILINGIHHPHSKIFRESG